MAWAGRVRVPERCVILHLFVSAVSTSDKSQCECRSVSPDTLTRRLVRRPKVTSARDIFALFDLPK